MPNVNISVHDEFKRQFKKLAKKYPSLKSDFIKFCQSIRENPNQGANLGHGGVHKVRMAIMSKGGGKSGGSRVITFVVKISEPDNFNVTLLTIYDKGTMDNIRDEYIVSLINF